MISGLTNKRQRVTLLLRLAGRGLSVWCGRVWSPIGLAGRLTGWSSPYIIRNNDCTFWQEARFRLLSEQPFQIFEFVRLLKIFCFNCF